METLRTFRWEWSVFFRFHKLSGFTQDEVCVMTSICTDDVHSEDLEQVDKSHWWCLNGMRFKILRNPPWVGQLACTRKLGVNAPGGLEALREVNAKHRRQSKLLTYNTLGSILARIELTPGILYFIDFKPWTRPPEQWNRVLASFHSSSPSSSSVDVSALASYKVLWLQWHKQIFASAQSTFSLKWALFSPSELFTSLRSTHLSWTHKRTCLNLYPGQRNNRLWYSGRFERRQMLTKCGTISSVTKCSIGRNSWNQETATAGSTQ